VGNGGQRGRRGYCVDQLTAGGSGPRLVVVPMAETDRFAIAKYEITWGEFAAFCATLPDCDLPANDALPVTGVAVEAAKAYANWLTEQSGFVYRLPRVEEWRAAVAGEPDPNRNCRIQVGGVQRGLSLLPAATGRAGALGLLHGLGNAQEWVETESGLQTAGGAYTDSLAQCTADRLVGHDGQPDALTGFRLVREIP
jgi:formylglycine-generating enzyme required for sulfatase activity